MTDSTLADRDASKVPPGPDNLPWLDLYNTSSWGSALYVTTLARDFDGHAGSVSFMVPQVDPGSYFVMRKCLLMPAQLIPVTLTRSWKSSVAAWGQSSYHFTIEA